MRASLTHVGGRWLSQQEGEGVADADDLEEEEPPGKEVAGASREYRSDNLHKTSRAHND